MLTDIRPIVERLLRKMVLAGLPLMSACDGTRTLGGADGAAGAGGAGPGGVGGVGGVMGTAGTTGSGGVTGSGGAAGTGVACQPFNLTCGVRSTCPSFTADGGVPTLPTPGFQIPLSTSMFDFDLDDARWVSLYRACVATGPACGPDCEGFCRAVNQANGVGFAQYSYYECEVTCADLNRFRTAYVAGVCGRRPAGSRGCQLASAGTPIARYLAEAAALEAASVPAFARLARDLAAHDAPTHLVRAARVATAEEARHWRRTRDLARRRGGDPVRPAVSPPTFASLEEIAVDNVVEGCVRETFGALVAAHQAVAAGDREIRALMVDIAEDELGHAALSWQIDAWACDRLGAAFRERRSQAARAAVGELLLAADHSVAQELCADAGLPGPADARALLVAAWESAWKPSFTPSEAG